jgi:predicted phage baseplate assembly protein
VFTLTDPTPLIAGALPFADWSQATAPLILSVEDSNGRTGVTHAALGQFILIRSGASDPFVSEYALVSVVEGTPVPYAHTQIQLRAPLANCYERASTSVNANVALVTHGQSVSEIMGSGNASTPNQSFALRQSPLTYVQAPTPTGAQSTLQVLANGVAWREVGSLYGATPSRQVFEVLNQSGGAADVLFGDGDEGALLPTGQGNLLANYRIGLGSSGNVGASTLTTLIDRPLGVSTVTNPEAATGGQDAQSLEDIRTNAPLSVLTLGRAVSLSDYEKYAAGFAGIEKANAQWVASGRSRGVFLTVAGVGGAALSPANPTLNNLIASLQNYGNPLIPITVQSFVETLFGFSADLQYDPSYQKPAVMAQVLQTLSTAFGFAQRNFGQDVSVDEISTVIQNVPGVVAVNVYSLNVVRSSTAGDLASFTTGFSLANWKNWIAPYVLVPRPPPITSISAYLPAANGQFLPLPAEILVLDPDPSSVVLGVMS